MHALDSCPGPDELTAFSAAGLAPAVRLAVEAHVDGCDACGAEVAAQIVSRREGGAQPPAAHEPGDLTAAAPSRYRLLGLVGAGGMGSVYEAVELGTNRRVALKLARELDGPANAAIRRRFFREARIAAFLEHPNLVPVLEINRFSDGAPYYTQRLIEGRPLGLLIAERKELPARLSLMRSFFEVCSGIAYAHGRGVVHRDLKPSNVIVGAAGETWVIDWGLAHVRALPGQPASVEEPESTLRAEVLEGLRSDPQLTVAGATVGTPTYMSPEQARGDPCDARSDVWSLGVLLVELLAGQPPFAGRDSNEVLRRLRAGEVPQLPAQIERQAPPELVAIARRALAPAPEQRYPSAAELAADVNAWMVGAKVAAYRYSAARELSRWVRRHLVLSVGILIAFVMGTGWLGSSRAAEQRLRRQQATMFMNAGRLAFYRFQWDRAAVNFAAALSSDPEYRAARIALSMAGMGAPVPRFRMRLDASVRLLAFASRDVLVAASGRELTALEMASGATLRRRSFDQPIVALVPCLAGPVLVALARGVTLWDAQSDRGAPVWPVGGEVLGAAVSPDCTLAAVRSPRAVEVIDLRTGKGLGHFAGAAVDVAFSAPARLWWATASGLHEAPDAHHSTEGPRPAVIPGRITALSAGGARLLVSRSEAAALLLDVGSPGAARVIADRQLPAPSLLRTLSADGLDRFSAGAGQSVALQVADTGLDYARLAGSNVQFVQVAVSADVSRLATLAVDGTLRTYDLANARSYAPGRPPGDADLAVLDVSPRGDRLATGSEDGSIWLWDAATGKPTALQGHHASAVRAVKFSRDGAWLASCAADGVRLWKPNLPGAAEAGPCVALAWVSAEWPLVLLKDGSVVQRDEGGRWSTFPRAPGGPIKGLDVSPDGKTLALASDDGLTLYDLPSRQVRTRLGAGKHLSRVAFSPEGRLIAASEDASDYTWDAATGAPLLDRLEIPGPGETTALAFLSAGAGSAAPGVLLSVHRGGALIKLRDEGAPYLLVARTLEDDVLVAAQPSPDGRRLAVLSARSGLRMLPLVSNVEKDPLERVARHYKFLFLLGDFTRDEERLRAPADAAARVR